MTGAFRFGDRRLTVEQPCEADDIVHHLERGLVQLAGFAQHAMRKGYISTPSYSQVIEPVDARAVSRWHPYRKYFEPVFPILGPVAGHWGYALAAD